MSPTQAAMGRAKNADPSAGLGQPHTSLLTALRGALAATLVLLSVAAWAQADPAPAASAAAARPLLTPGPQLRADGLPPLRRLPRAEADAPRPLRFVDWHPQRAEMLVVAPGASTDAGAPQLHSLSAPGARPRQLTRGRSAVQRGLWEPQQGAYVVYSRDTDGDEAWRLYRLDAEGREAPVALTPSTLRVADYAFLPAGRGLVTLVTTLDRNARPAPAEAEGDASPTATAEGPAAAAPPAPGARQVRSELWRLDPLQPEQAPTILASVEGTRLGELRVLPGGDVVLLHSTARGSRYWRHPWQGGPARAVGNRAQIDTPLRVGMAQDEDEDEDEDESERLWLRQAEGDFRQLIALDVGSGRRQRFAAGPAAELEGLAVPPPGGPPRPLALVHNEQGLSVLRLFIPEGDDGQLRRPPGVPPGVIGALAWHPRLPLLAFNHVSTTSPGRPWVLDLAKGEVQPWVAHPAAAAPADVVLPELRTLRWKSFDGEEITALHLPPPAHFTGPRPVFIEIHGGPSSQVRPSYLQGTQRHLVHELGMHLVLPNVRGSDGFGRRFRDLDNGRRREDAVRDISSLLDQLAALPGVDAGRVVVSGGSYGGYMALAVAAAESSRILGAINRVGISNFVTLLENTESYRRDNRRQEYGDERDPEMRRFLNGISPLNRVAAMKKPMFVVHGRNDPRVPWGEAEQIVKALRQQGTPVWFLTAEDEGHGFTKADNRSVLHHATVEFVQRLLEGRAVDDRP